MANPSADDLLRATALAPGEARILLAHALGWRRTDLITRGDAVLPAARVDLFAALERRRLAGEPIAYLVGAREFYGLDLSVNPDVLIPRPETELLVDLTLDALAGCEAPHVLDLGTGSGAIALAVAHARPDATVTAVDRSPAALSVAAGNAARVLRQARPGGPLRLLASDWYAALDPATARFDLIVANPPYIAAADPHLRTGDLRFEPATALTDGADGLAALRVIVAGAPRYLREAGNLLLEHGFDQGLAVRALLTGAGFQDVRTARDLAGHERVGRATWRGPH